MMNLQLLITAADASGNSTYREMAISHANKTMQNHIRPDGSSYHVVDYDPTNGQVLWKRTAQGFSNESTWTRGHAWGTLGFALMYIATGISAYFDTAIKMAVRLLDDKRSLRIADPAPEDRSLGICTQRNHRRSHLAMGQSDSAVPLGLLGSKADNARYVRHRHLRHRSCTPHFVRGISREHERRANVESAGHEPLHQYWSELWDQYERVPDELDWRIYSRQRDGQQPCRPVRVCFLNTNRPSLTIPFRRPLNNTGAVYGTSRVSTSCRSLR